jgi:hypothetical protein
VPRIYFAALLAVILSGVLGACVSDDDGGDDSDDAAGDDDTASPSDDAQTHGDNFCGLVAEYDAGYREDCHGVTVVHVAGAPYDIGYQTGVLMRPEITNLIHLVRTYIDPLGIVWDLLQEFPRNLEPNIHPEFVEEMQGMVDGLNNDVTYKEIMTGNCLGDVFGSMRAFLDNYTNVDWCSLGAAWDEATTDGELIVTRNFDYMNIFSSNNYVAVVEPDNGHAFVTTGIAGIIGIHTGMNDAGITGSLAYNSSYDSDMSGVPMLLILREAVQYGDTVEDAENLITSSNRTMGLNYMFTDGYEKKVDILEVSGEKYAVRRAQDEDFIIATNHYVDPSMVDEQKGYDDDHTSMVRYARLMQLFSENYGKIDMTVAGKIMRDHYDSLLGIDMPGRVTICRHDDLDYEEGSLMNQFVSTSTPSVLMKPIEGEYCTTVTRHACEMPYFCIKPFEAGD